MVAPPITTYATRRATDGWTLPVLVLGVTVCAGGALLGLWWLSVAVGAAIGLLLGGGRALWTALLAGALGWGLALLWMQLHTSIWPVAVAVSGILGLGSNGAIAIAVTLLFAGLLGLAGAWVGSAVRALALPKRSDSLRSHR
jgi:hypothetical protein